MHNYAVASQDNPLKWETARQNQIHQEAIEQKKKQGHSAGMHRENQFIDRVVQTVASTKSYLGSSPLTDNSASLPMHSGVDDGSLEELAQMPYQVRRIPDMRSAWMPFDETERASEWSRPFSLPKADMEPWLSFFKGYKQSSLFIQNPSAGSGAGGEDGLQLDFALRALLELRQLSAAVILEPPVQINSQVEYIDLAGAMDGCRDLAQAKSLAKVASSTHESQLRKAVERGLDIGNRLHDVLLGDGHSNLIRAWERVHQRKPTIEELHLMLTTGRLKVERRQPSMQEVRVMPRPEPVASVTRNQVSAEESTSLPQTDVPSSAVSGAAERDDLEGAADATKEEKTSLFQASPRKHSFLLYAFHVTACTAAIVAYVWLF